MSPTWLVDISNWQSDISIEQIAREGYSACVCKATEGVMYRDPWFVTYLPRVRGSGMIPGAYHYLRAGEAARQARCFLDRVEAQGGPGGFLIQLDCESDATAEDVRQWAAEWNRLTGNHPFLIYSGAWWWPRTGGLDGAAITPYLWHSRYVDGSDYGSRLYEKVPDSWWTPGYGGWDRATILQFSSRGLVAGRRIDVSAYLGTVDQLRQLTCVGGRS
jgi:lysozyme